MTARVLVIAIALALAGLTAYLMQDYLIGAPGTAEAPPRTTVATKILVADTDLPAGTILNSAHWRWQSWPADAVDETYEVERKGFEAEAAYGGAAVRRAIGAGEPITKARVFRRGDKGFLAGALSPGKRAVGIQISAVSSAAGFIRPGDRVDVILTQQLRRRDKTPDGPQIKVVSETILSDIRVLAIVQHVDVYGDGVNVAARLEGMAEPGGVVVSADVVLHTRAKVEAEFEDLGPRKVKNIAEPVQTFRVHGERGLSAVARQEPELAPSTPISTDTTSRKPPLFRGS